MSKAGRVFLSWISLIKEDSEYYFAKAMDMFYDLPSCHRKAFLSYIVNFVDNEDWADKLDDETHYPEVLRSVLFYYSGREQKGEPCLKDFAEDMIAGYLRSKDFKALSVRDISFKSSLEDV